MKYSYTIENLNCAHCAGKIEQKIASSKGFENVSYNFATKQLNFYSEKRNPVAEIQSICDSIEDGTRVIDNADQKACAEEKKFSLDKLFLALSIVLGIAAIILEHTVADTVSWGKYLVFGLCFAATLLAGWEVFVDGFKNIIKLRIDETTLMSVAVIAAFCLGEFVEAAMVAILFSLGEFIEEKAVNNSRRDIEKLAKIRPDTATLICDGNEITVPAEKVEIGSEIVVKPYDRIPLDGVVVLGRTTVDNSALTGEGLPVEACEGSEVMSGSVNGSSLIRIKTTKAFGDSTATRILNLVEDAAAQKGKSEKLISRFASVYTPIVIAISLLLAVVPPLLGFGSFADWIYRALVCLVASCPCAIVISVPLSYYSGIGAASKAGVLVKGGKYLEALAKADTFVFDKTGTLTSGKLSVDKITAYGTYFENDILSYAAACEKYSTHPVALAIKDRAKSLELPQLAEYEENAGCGTSAMLNGKKLKCGGTRILNDIKGVSHDASASVFVVYDGELIGTIAVSDSVRQEAKGVVSSLKALGVRNTVMLTGDARKNAEKVANELGLDDFKAELLPDDKLKNVLEIKKSSTAVCYVGDGINDAPVLSASDCGIAMGLGSEAAIEASDAVLSAGNLSGLPKAVKIAKKALRTIHINITFALLVKAAVIILAAFGVAAMWMSVVADTGVCVLCVLYAAGLLKK